MENATKETLPAHSPQQIALRCPRCMSESKHGLLGYVTKHDMGLMVQNVVKTKGPLLLVDVTLHCQKHNLNVVYMIVDYST